MHIQFWFFKGKKKKKRGTTSDSFSFCLRDLQPLPLRVKREYPRKRPGDPGRLWSMRDAKISGVCCVNKKKNDATVRVTGYDWPTQGMPRPILLSHAIENRAPLYDDRFQIANPTTNNTIDSPRKQRVAAASSRIFQLDPTFPYIC